jgi:hypothetical protein
MVLYSGVSDMFQYNSADGMIDSINVDIVMGGGALVNTPALVQSMYQSGQHLHLPECLEHIGCIRPQNQ